MPRRVQSPSFSLFSSSAYSDNIQEYQEEAHVINILNSSVSDPIDHEYLKGDKHSTIKEEHKKEDKQKVGRKARHVIKEERRT